MKTSFGKPMHSSWLVPNRSKTPHTGDTVVVLTAGSGLDISPEIREPSEPKYCKLKHSKDIPSKRAQRDMQYTGVY